MGASSSTDHSLSSQSQQQHEEEVLAASTTPLPVLRAAFSSLSASCLDSNSPAIPCASLRKVLSVTTAETVASRLPDHFPALLPRIGPAIADLFFPPSKDGLDWLGFLRGYNRCCARSAASFSVAGILRVYSAACAEDGVPPKLAFDSDDLGEGKVSGSLAASDVVAVLWICWIMGRLSRGSKGDKLALPDVSHLVISASVSCGEIADDEGIWDFDVFGSEISLPANKFCMWVLATAPGLAHCLSEFVQGRIRACATAESSTSTVVEKVSFGENADQHLLTCGRAWAISLSQRNSLGEELLAACVPRLGVEALDNLLYRSSIHGKGLSRFWSKVEGYNGPLLILLSGTVADTHKGGENARNWIIGILTGQGLENRDTFYGSSGNLFAIRPFFRALGPSGKDKNFMYCHLHPSVRVYEPHPKPVGLAFGGTIGNERIFIDEDFAKITIRHHAVDKTYQHGSLLPNQGFLAVEASLAEAEVWGLGGKAAKEHQDIYRKRETLFSEQRRKVDLKTFASWEDSPEKMMMDMVSDPNRVRREDR